jgi:hypothetical protein
VPIRKWFQSEECLALPLTDVTSRYFWITEPREFHTFDTIRAIIDNDRIDFPEEDEVEEEQDSGDDEEIDDQQWNTTAMTDEEFRKYTHWYIFNERDFPKVTCAICHIDTENGNRISVLDCKHQYHQDCIHPWLTERSSLCPTCRQKV